MTEIKRHKMDNYTQDAQRKRADGEAHREFGREGRLIPAQRGDDRPVPWADPSARDNKEAGSLFGSGLLTLVAGAGFEPATSGL